YAPPALVDGTTDDRRLRSLVKIDAAPAVPFRLQGFYEREAADIDGSGGGPIATTQVGTIRNHVWNARVTWTPWDATAVDAHVNGFRGGEDYEPRPPFTRAGPPYVNDFGGLVPSSGAAGYNELHQRSVITGASFTRYLDHGGQRHEFKG